MTVLGVAERALKKEVHWRTYISVLILLLFSAFYLSWRDVTLKLETQPDSALPPIKLDVADMEGRNEIASIRAIVDAANETLQHQQIDLDVLAKPIVSATFFIRLRVAGKKESPRHEPRSGAVVALSDTSIVFLRGKTTERDSEEDGYSTFLLHCPFDRCYMGQPVRELARATHLDVFLDNEFAPVGSQVDGNIMLVLNSQISLTFEIRTIVVRQSESLPFIVITDIKNGLEPLRRGSRSE